MATKKNESKELATKPETQPAVKEKNITDAVLARIEEMTAASHLHLPKNFSAPNALKSAMIILQDLKKDGKFVLDFCTKPSIQRALLKMVVLGLNPHKKQGSFIAYGNELSFNAEYAGNIAMAKRNGLKWIKANAILQGDKFDFEVDIETGRKKILEHKQTLESIGSKTVLGAYTIYCVVLPDGTEIVDTEIMNMAQIRQAWEQGPMKGNSPAHKNFPDQMSCKTVINRACKLINNTSDDSGLAMEFDESGDRVSDAADNEISENANKEPIGFTETEDITETQEPQTNEQANGPGPQVETELSEAEKKDAAKGELGF